jgi:hypothetical protein
MAKNLVIVIAGDIYAFLTVIRSRIFQVGYCSILNGRTQK